MSDATFGSILDKPSSEIERPKPLPTGTYQCIVDGQPRMDKSSKKGTEFVEFSLRPMGALDDVNEKDLIAALTSGDGSVKALSDKRIRATYYLTEDALWRLKKFLVNDLQITEGKKKIRQMVSEAQNQQVLATIKHVPSEDGTGIFPQLASTAPVAE
jgi:hypothetical protein